MSQHAEYHYSVTIKTEDKAILQCLRALSQYTQVTGNNRIPWGGTKKEDWERSDHCVTFNFSEQDYRRKFMEEISRLLPKKLWVKIEENDDNPATPQS